jgi:4-azaleucine resistance transporter AzlC
VPPWRAFVPDTAHTQHSLRDGVRAALPLILPTLLVGISYGALAKPVLGSVAPIVMSVVVFAGSAQFAVLSVFAAGGGAVEAILAGLLLNLRFLPMGFAVAPALHGRPLARAVQGQALVDASFAIASRGDGSFDRELLLGSTIPQAACWIGGTAIGVLAGSLLGNPETIGLDGLFLAFFLYLVVGEVNDRRALLAAVLGATVTLALMPFSPAGVPVVAAAAAALIGLGGRRA